MGTLAIVAYAALALAPGEVKEFHGTVVDTAGKPVAEALVDTYWAVADGKLAPRGGTRTGADGNFKIRIECNPGRPNPLMAVDKAVTVGGAVVLDPEHPEANVTIKLGRMVPVRGEIKSTKLGAPIEGCFASVFYEDAIIALVGISCSGKFALQLPPGEYRLSYNATDCIAAKGTASVAADAKEVDFGTTDLAPTILSQLYGKTPPDLKVSAARGVSESVKLADYKGKWVLLEFWGYW